jgi:hypothetical protein
VIEHSVIAGSTRNRRRLCTTAIDPGSRPG